MRRNLIRRFLLASVPAVLLFSALHNTAANEAAWTDDATQTVTLYSQIKHKDFAKANFNFALGVRGDSQVPATRNIYDIRYGGYGLANKSDWLDVPTGENSYSQIKDLGPMNWSEVSDVPILEASQWPVKSGPSLNYSNGTLVNMSPDNILVKAIPGHMYVLRSKHDSVDMSVLFRVDAMRPGDECTISWKVIPSQE